MPRIDDIFRSPFADELTNAEVVLIAGAGGGFDVFSGLPLYFALQAAGKTVHLANLSFTFLADTTAERLAGPLWRVDHRTTGAEAYFPERYLAEWLHLNGLPSDVYAFDKVGVRPLGAAYADLCRQLRVDALVLVDGGTDILMRGDEAGLGTPAEDMSSLAAVRHLPVPHKLVSWLGFGVDAFHGVCHAHFLENVAGLEREGGYLGSHSIQLGSQSVERFRQALEHVHARMPSGRSIVNGSILSALEGHFGDVHRTERTRSSQLFINPLMAMYWHFRLDAVAARSLYLHLLDHTETQFEVHALIEAFRGTAALRPRAPIPV